MLFLHETRDVTFCLVVDDFGVKFSDEKDLDHLLACLSHLFHVKAHSTGTKYLGFTVHHDRPARTLTLSYPCTYPDRQALFFPRFICPP